MQNFVELWVYLSSTPLFGLTATMAVYVLAHAFYTARRQAPWANPVLWTVVVIAGGLLLTGVPYPSYFSGAQFIHFLLGPAVVALAWPLWQRRAELQARLVPLLLAALVGGGTAAGSAWALGHAFGLPVELVQSLTTKSVTAPVAMGVAEKIGGIPALAAVFAVLTGMVGALSGKYLFDMLHISTQAEGWMTRGFALGTTSHGLGAARAMQVDADAGAYAALAMGLQVVLASVLIPLVFRWL
jgi:predicted murein hydrolase (TIGR00659 family)